MPNKILRILLKEDKGLVEELELKLYESFLGVEEFWKFRSLRNILENNYDNKRIIN